MRVIAGKYRGKPLASPKTNKVRPTADIVKQALFTKLQFFVEGKSVLDLFAGSGVQAKSFLWIKIIKAWGLQNKICKA